MRGTLVQAELIRRARLIAAYARGELWDIPGPEALMVETTVRCNLRCPMCPRTGAGLPQADMPDELLYPLLEQHAALGGDHIYLYGLGEPLLDERIFDVLDRCRALGLTTIVSSNATLLDAERRRRLLASGCDHFIASLDAASAPTYARYRPGGDYARTVDRVAALAAEKLASGSALSLVVQFVRMRGNSHEIEAFRARWRAVPGVDRVRLKSEDIGLAEHALREADGYRRRNPCHVLWRGPLIVRYTGQVYTCYHYAGAGAGRPLGDLSQRSLESIWNDPEQVALRRAHRRRALAPGSPCGSCPAVRPRLPFILGAIAAGGRTMRGLIPLAERAALRFPGLLEERSRDAPGGR